MLPRSVATMAGHHSADLLSSLEQNVASGTSGSNFWILMSPMPGCVAITGAGGFLGQLARAECEAVEMDSGMINNALMHCDAASTFLFVKGIALVFFFRSCKMYDVN